MKAVILIDTREKDLHLLHEFQERGFQCKRKKLCFGDYSFEINGVSYENRICVERKSNLDEIIGNLTKGRERFKREFERSKGCKVILMVEASLDQLEAKEYRSRMSPKDLLSFLKTWSNKFQLELKFVKKDEACNCILDCFKKHLNL